MYQGVPLDGGNHHLVPDMVPLQRSKVDIPYGRPSHRRYDMPSMTVTFPVK